MVKRLSGTRFVAVSLLSLALLMPGCVSQYGEQQTKVNHYPQCYEPIQKLRDDENSVAKSTAAGAAIGALTGAVVGGLATGSAKGAVAGAVAGGAAGAIGGNIYGKKQAEKRDAEYMARYASMLDED
ncbi:MAG: glycine zipper domain-containing protein, partial [Desulfovibrionaceae bacterium]|nr:glycine zipper domain-containing protein [Desulfovibrionaceae bacterium]